MRGEGPVASCGRLLLVLAAVLLLGGCIGGRPAHVDWAMPGVSAVWPDPPAPPRIRFLRYLGQGGKLRKEGRSGGFAVG